METLTRSTFDEQLAEAIHVNSDFVAGLTINVEIAWDAYRADPERFHRATPDNPDGNPILDFILQNGPWWTETAEAQA